MDYKSAGVDVSLEEQAARIMYEAARETWKNRTGLIGEVIVPFDDFSGIRYIDVSKLKNIVANINFDGVGTKIELAERINNHSTIAFDLFAMVCDDVVIRGGEPVLAGSILDVNKLNLEAIRQLAQGYIEAAKAANIAIINGEIAQLVNRVSGFGEYNYNWGACCLWFAEKKKLITGEQAQEKDVIISFQEKGFRSNGISLARKAFSKVFGENWHEKEFEGKTLGEQVLQPSTIYSKTIIELIGSIGKKPQCKLHALAHITGGGIIGKLGRALKPSGLGAELSDLLEPCNAMLYAQESGEVSDEEAYKSWNMGNGMMIITKKREAEKIIETAKANSIEAKIVGKTILENEIRLTSKGKNSAGKEIVFSQSQ